MYMFPRLLCTPCRTLPLPSTSIFSPIIPFLGRMKPRQKSPPTADHGVSPEKAGVLEPSFGPSTYDHGYEKIWPAVSASCSSGSNDKTGARVEQRSIVGSRSFGTYELKCSPVKDSTSPEEEPSLASRVRKKRWVLQRREVKIPNLGPYLEQSLDGWSRDSGTFQQGSSPMEDSKNKQDEHTLPTSFGKKPVANPTRMQERHEKYSGNVVGSFNSDHVECLPFDICPSVNRKSILPPKLRESNRDEPIEMDGFVKRTGQILRSGMVLLPNFLSLRKQVKMVKKCRKLGLGPGGFDRPGYQGGAKLRLQMMCLGLNWDPQRKNYEETRRSDGAKPPRLPRAFSSLVKKALQDSHALIQQHVGESNVEDILPGMSPDICIVNFYTESGRLGLHQDRDESRESLCRRLPVISFSIGDTGEFLYKDKRDDKEEKILLHSGDVLIFGGNSRHIFHVVKSIIPNTAPLPLLEETMLRPGRLNLTFRQF